MIDDVSRHAAEEENQIFPALRDKCGPEELHELGDKIRRVKSIAPTHAHPSAPDTPPANMMVGLVDRVRDALTRH